MLSAKKELFTPSGGSYQISRSVRLRSSASAYFNRTPSVIGNRKTFTWSGWVKIGQFGVASNPLFGAIISGTSNVTEINFDASNRLDFFSQNTAGTVIGRRTTTQVFRDPSAWYHIVVAIDTSDATASNRIKLYVNGNQITSFAASTDFALNDNTGVNDTTVQRVGARASGTYFFDGYLTEVNFIDGQALTPSSFGETNALTGVWQPKRYAGTYGTNGFYLNFSDNSAATATTIGKDYSGNGNNWTPNNISVTAGVTYDSMIDVPTLYADGGNGRGNYAVLNPLDKNTNIALSEGNLTAIPSSTADYWLARATMAFPTTGKWYWELTLNNTPYLYQAGIYSYNRPNSGSTSATGNEYQVAWGTAFTYIQFQSNNAAFAAWGTNTNPTSGNVLMFAYDADNATMWVGRNGTWYNTSGTANPATNTDPRFSSIPSGLFAGVNLPNPASGGVSMNFGQRPFTYTPPTGFKALNTQNLPTPTISNGATVMAATLYTGNSPTGQNITNTVNSVSFQPDFVWIKNRSTVGGYNHQLFDSVRGATKVLRSSVTGSEYTDANGMTAFNSNGFSVGSNADEVNLSGAAFVGWQWNAGGTTVTNTSGTISAQVRANATAGFSIVTCTFGNGSIGHGLGVAPKMIIGKGRGPTTGNWIVFHSGLANMTDKYLNLNGTAIVATLGTAVSAPTSTLFYGNGGYLPNAESAIFYCFAAVAGYSAFGSYTGNGVPDGPFVYLGFRPRFVMIKNTTNAQPWIIIDTARNTFNVAGDYLSPDNPGAENYASSRTTATNNDILSNGFKLRNDASSSGYTNASANTYIYAAFAENPFKLSLAR